MKNLSQNSAIFLLDHVFPSLYYPIGTKGIFLSFHGRAEIMENNKRTLIGTLLMMTILVWTIDSLSAPPVLNKTNPDPKNAEIKSPPTPPALPDLTVEYIKIIPEKPELGKTMTVQVSVKNIGAGGASQSKVQIFIMNLDDVQNIYTSPVPPLAPGQSQAVNRSINLNAKNILPGHYLVIAKIMPEGNQEFNTSNNHTEKDFYIVASGQAGQPLPDLAITNFSMTPPTPVSGGPATIALTVINKGPGTSPAGSGMFAPNPAVNAFSPDTINFSLPPLSPGQSTTLNFSAVGSKLKLSPGTYTIKISINPLGFPETTMDNNYKELTFSVQIPTVSQGSKEPMQLKLPNQK
jgi:hypothetical protein